METIFEPREREERTPVVETILDPAVETKLEPNKEERNLIVETILELIGRREPPQWRPYWSPKGRRETLKWRLF
jgi:hypothetical protein